jgi:hypothetical protein
LAVQASGAGAARTANGGGNGAADLNEHVGGLVAGVEEPVGLAGRDDDRLRVRR